MNLHAPVILILLSSVVIISYLFNLFSRKTNIPSVLMLIGTGIAIKYTSLYYGMIQTDVNKLVKILGIAGLIMIVLEAALDLKLSKNKVKLIGDSFASALFIFLISAFGIGFLVMQWLDVPFDRAFLYAVPLSIISSAIVIPSTSHLPEEKREFIIYESSFSDIFGILVFNYMLMGNIASLGSAFKFVTNIGIAILFSVLASLLMIYLLTKITINIKFFLVFAVLSLLYSLGELIHLPALLIVLVFGLVINNSTLVIRGRLSKWISIEGIETVVDAMKSITAETSFLIRTFFFILFGYTINLDVLVLPDVWKLGSIIILILLFVRFFYLRMILKSNLFPELFLMPRGLVTILLFYSIPASHSIGGFNEGILFFIVAVSSVLMMIGLLLFRKDKQPYLESSEEAI
ncbi:MAG TPA: cation:proton antiporter [Flavipsychrobacter sp.]|nr:cation:proton antiporter [Flavipsychrobacter sp.]